MGKTGEKSDSSLFFKIFHKIHLMLMDVCQGKGIRSAFLGIKAHRQALYRADIVNSAFLVKIGQGDMAFILIDSDRGDRRGDFLDESQSVFLVFSLVRLIRSSSVDPRSPL